MDIIDLNKPYQGEDLAKAFKIVCIKRWESQPGLDLTELAQKLTSHIQSDDVSIKRLKSAVNLIAMNATHSGRTNAYHNPIHTARVAMMTAFYSNFSQVSDIDYLKNLCAAFGHDKAHPGRGNPSEDPFYNERISATQTGNLMHHCGVDYADVIDVETIILPTSPNGGHEFIKNGANPDDPILNQAPELKRICNNPLLHRMACILIDADLFESAGVDYDTFVRAGIALSKESAKCGENVDFCSLGSQKYFIDHIVGKKGFLSIAAQYLAGDNFQKIRDRVLTNNRLTPTG